MHIVQHSNLTTLLAVKVSMVGRRVSLRLDDGSLICQGVPGEGLGAVRITVQRALELNRAGEAEARRLENLLNTARALIPRTNGEAAVPLAVSCS